MTEEAWAREANPQKLLSLLGPDFSRRKLRHFVCDCVRHQLPAEAVAQEAHVLTFAERIADDEATVDPDEWVAVHQELDERAARWTAGAAPDHHALLLDFTIAEDIYDEAHWLLGCLQDAEVDDAIPRGLLREMFGNPFRPVDFAPWRTDTAVSLARQMYESREFGAMPILADALQDAGCDNPDVLNHCRDANQLHVRGCWVVDGVLGLE